MKSYTYWWGVVLVPESGLDVETLEGLPRSHTRSYEGGRIVWESDEDELKMLKLDSIPMGKVLVLER
jgi:hypothetical protein